MAAMQMRRVRLVRWRRAEPEIETLKRRNCSWSMPKAPHPAWLLVIATYKGGKVVFELGLRQ